MGLKFERSNDLDKLFDSFAVDPLKKEVPLEELAKQRQEVKKEEAKKQAKESFGYHLGSADDVNQLKKRLHVIAHVA